MSKPLSHSRLHIVTGKGGVGKTVVATALAYHARAQGKRVLLAEANGGDRIAALLGMPPTSGDMRQIESNLWLVNIQPRKALHEYALMTLRFEALYKAVFENKFVRQFLRLVPSLAELVILGKIWYHEQEQDDLGPRFDLIVLDAPATGHALGLLRAPQVVMGTVPPGPIRENARLMHGMITDPARTQIHVVTTPEEMPVVEANELASSFANELKISLGRTFLNQIIDPLPESGLRTLQHAVNLDSSAAMRSVVELLKLREQKRLQGEAYLQQLSPLLQQTVRLPRVLQAPFGKLAIEQLAAILQAHNVIGQ